MAISIAVMEWLSIIGSERTQQHMDSANLIRPADAPATMKKSGIGHFAH
jgi:hypothetical protein